MHTFFKKATSFQPQATSPLGRCGLYIPQITKTTKRIKNNKINNKTTQMQDDIFDNKILCKECGKQMDKKKISKKGFTIRAMVCPNPKCDSKIIHPIDKQEYEKYIDLRNKEFKVKMRLVGNSYAVSIPKEIVSFMNEQRKMMDEMVKLCFEDFGRLSLKFRELRKK